jgi:hypothetical protein
MLSLVSKLSIRSPRKACNAISEIVNHPDIVKSAGVSCRELPVIFREGAAAIWVQAAAADSLGAARGLAPFDFCRTELT